MEWDPGDLPLDPIFACAHSRIFAHIRCKRRAPFLFGDAVIADHFQIIGQAIDRFYVLASKLPGRGLVRQAECRAELAGPLDRSQDTGEGDALAVLRAARLSGATIRAPLG